MSNQTIFKRYEKKYLVSSAQKDAFLSSIDDMIQPDYFGESTVCNIYFDTPSFRLIRASIEKPIYKEKLRLRTYGVPRDDSNSFIELKKKYRGVVYKRRIPIEYDKAFAYLVEGKMPDVREKHKQVLSEIDYFINYYEKIAPAASIFYDRIAFYCKTDKELRFTFDSNIRFRTDNFDLRNGSDGEIILPEDLSVLEIKCLGSMPVRVAKALSESEIYPSSFSKYGQAYMRTYRSVG